MHYRLIATGLNINPYTVASSATPVVDASKNEVPDAAARLASGKIIIIIAQ